MRFFAGVFLGLLSVSCSSHTCTLIGCMTHVDLLLSKPLEEEGQYEILVETDGEKMRCSVSVPATNEDDCDDRLGVRREEITTREGNAVSGRSGDTIESVGVIGVFESLKVSIKREDSMLVDVTLEPEYEDEELNGPGCGTCPRAEHQLQME